MTKIQLTNFIGVITLFYDYGAHLVGTGFNEMTVFMMAKYGF